MKNVPAITAVLLAALLGGCALSEAECRNSDWFKLGERDALTYGMPPQVEVYAVQCSRYGIKLENEPYMTGWRDGNLELRRRQSQTGVGSE